MRAPAVIWAKRISTRQVKYWGRRDVNHHICGRYSESSYQMHKSASPSSNPPEAANSPGPADSGLHKRRPGSRGIPGAWRRLPRRSGCSRPPWPLSSHLCASKQRLSKRRNQSASTNVNVRSTWLKPGAPAGEEPRRMCLGLNCGKTRKDGVENTWLSSWFHLTHTEQQAAASSAISSSPINCSIQPSLYVKTQRWAVHCFNPQARPRWNHRTDRWCSLPARACDE